MDMINECLSSSLQTKYDSHTTAIRCYLTVILKKETLTWYKSVLGTLTVEGVVSSVCLSNLFFTV